MMRGAVIAEPPPYELIRGIHFGSFDWNTHPIDLVYGPQGWGPFDGPWTPFDFQSPATMMAGGYGIDATWNSGNNQWLVGPQGSGSGGLTIFRDKATSSVANSAPAPAFQPVGAGAATIAQGSPLEANSNGVVTQAKSLWSALKKQLGVQT